MSQSYWIAVGHGRSEIVPAPNPSLVEGVLACQQKEVEITPQGRYEWRPVTIQMCDVSDRDSLVFATGLVVALAECLKAAGATVTVVDHRRFSHRHDFSVAESDDCSWEHREMLQKMHQNPLGQIQVTDHAEMLRYICEICRCFPKARVLIPIAQKGFGWWLREKLNESKPPLHVELKRSGWPTKMPKRMIIGMSSLLSANPDHWDIILFLDAHRATHAAVLRGMAQFATRIYRCYSFVQRGSRLSSLARLRLEAVSGHLLSRGEEKAKAIKVLWQRSPTCRRSPSPPHSLEWKRDTIWNNCRRNDQVAAVARAFFKQDFPRLGRYGVPIPNEDCRFSNIQSPKIVILVESVEHGQQLQKRLDGWQFYSGLSTTAVLCDSMDSYRKIITISRAASAGFDANVCINAAGGSGLAAFRNVIAEDEGKEPEIEIPVFIVDFVDEHDATAYRDSRARAREYELLGWKQSPVPTTSLHGEQERQRN